MTKPMLQSVKKIQNVLDNQQVYYIVKKLLVRYIFSQYTAASQLFVVENGVFVIDSSFV
jgi:hypothetical protein